MKSKRDDDNYERYDESRIRNCSGEQGFSPVTFITGTDGAIGTSDG